MFKLISHLFFVVVCLFSLQNCDSPPEKTQEFQQKSLPDSLPMRHTKKVAILLPLSGEHSKLGQQLLKSAELALFSFENHNIELLPKDTKGDPKMAKIMTEEAIHEGVELILGPLFASEIDSIRPLAIARTIPILSFTNSLEKAGQGVFVFGFSPDSQTRSILNFAHNQGYKHYAALLPESPFGHRIQEELLKFIEEHRLPPAVLLFYQPKTRGFEMALEKLRTEKVEALLIPEGGGNVLEIAKYMHEMGLSHIRLLGSGQWDDDIITSNPLMEGGWYPALKNSKGWFEKAYESSYGERPHRLASLAFDMVSLAISLNRSSPKNPFTYQTLIRPEGFKGVDGFFKIHSSGETERALKIFHITEGIGKEIGDRKGM